MKLGTIYMAVFGRKLIFRRSHSSEACSVRI